MEYIVLASIGQWQRLLCRSKVRRLLASCLRELSDNCGFDFPLPLFVVDEEIETKGFIASLLLLLDLNSTLHSVPKIRRIVNDFAVESVSKPFGSLLLLRNLLRMHFVQQVTIREVKGLITRNKTFKDMTFADFLIKLFRYLCFIDLKYLLVF